MALSNESSSNNNMNLKDADKPFKYGNYEGTDWGRNMGLFHGNSGGMDSSPQPNIQSQYMLFAKSKMNPVCNRCLSAGLLTGWDCCRQCLRNSNNAHLNCYLCVNCYPESVDWLHRKAGVIDGLKAASLSNVRVQMEYVSAKHCPVIYSMKCRVLLMCLSMI